jgi:hypothetical protein
VAVAAVAVATLTAATERTGLLPLFTVPVGSASVEVDDSNAYVVAGLAPATTVTAYRVRDGGVQWRRDVRGATSAWVQAAGGGVLLATASCDDRSDTTVTWLDSTSGEPRWHNAGTPAGLAAGGRVLVVQQNSPTTCGPEPDGGVSRSLVGIEAVTGRPAWSIPIGSDDDGAFSPARDAARRLVLLQAYGTVQLWDVTSGANLASAEVADLATVYDGNPDTRTKGVAIVDDVLLLTSLAGEQAVVRGYGLDPLAERWRYRTGRDVLPSAYAAAPCGHLLCLLGEDRTTALDPATGRQVWQSPTVLHTAVGKRVIAEDAHGLRLLDAASGRGVAAWPSWHVLAPLRRGDQGVLAVRVAAGRTQVAQVDPARDDLRMLGAVTGGLAACELRGARLLCTTPVGEVEAWRVLR